jgi:diguanylate cyclase (GGDEF)-like protein
MTTIDPASGDGGGKQRSASAAWPQIFTRLAFDEPLESQFRLWYAAHVRTRIRSGIWIAMGSTLFFMLVGGPLAALRETIFGTHNQFVVDVLRFAFLVPSSLAMLAITYSELYPRWFGTISQIVAPLHAICFVAMDLLMRPQGYSLSSWMPLIVLSPYFLFGMLQAQAVRSAAMIVVAYAIGGYMFDLADGQRHFDVAVTVFAAVLGGAIHHSLQKSVRQTYLSTQLLNETAHRDALTGIHNRRMFDEHIARMWQQAARARVPLALLMIDIDHFKAYNDRLGHQAGDGCLIKVAGVIARSVRRPLDLVARYGGEEFAVLLYDARRDRVEDICRQLHATLAAHAIAHPTGASSGCVTFSIGAACIEPQPHRRTQGLVQLADEALYAAKERGRNRTIVMDREYETMDTGTFRVHRSHDVAA